MNDTSKEQVIEGTLKAMDEIGEYNQEMKDYVKRRLERAYGLGYSNGQGDKIKEVDEFYGRC